jgi:hypothetical protein
MTRERTSGDAVCILEQQENGMAEERKPSKGEPVFRGGETGGGSLGEHFGGRRSHHGNKPGGTLGSAEDANYDPTLSQRSGQSGEVEDKDIARGIAERTTDPRRRK